jgi:hypothetical protein
MAIIFICVYDAAANLCGQLEPVYVGASGAETDEGARSQENGGICERGLVLIRYLVHNTFVTRTHTS